MLVHTGPPLTCVNHARVNLNDDPAKKSVALTKAVPFRSCFCEKLNQARQQLALPATDRSLSGC